MNKVSDGQVREVAWSRWGIDLKRMGQEWHGACPQCGGKDRFWINSAGHYQCRQCTFTGWLDDGKSLDPIELAKWLEEKKSQEARRLIDIQNRLRELRASEHSAYLRGRDDEASWIAKEYFNAQGINDYLIERYQLGYVPDHPVDVGDRIDRLPAYTIPIRHPMTGELVNYQFRLKDPVPSGVGKYRQISGLPASAFYARPMPDGIKGDAVVVEGAKKSIVTYDRLGGKIQVVGLPGATPSRQLLEQLKPFSRIWLVLDPGCEEQADRIKFHLPQTSIVVAPGKIDDLFLGGMTVQQFRNLCKRTR